MNGFGFLTNGLFKKKSFCEFWALFVAELMIFGIKILILFHGGIIRELLRSVLSLFSLIIAQLKTSASVSPACMNEKASFSKETFMIWLKAKFIWGINISWSFWTHWFRKTSCFLIYSMFFLSHCLSGWRSLLWERIHTAAGWSKKELSKDAGIRISSKTKWYPNIWDEGFILTCRILRRGYN